MYADRYGKADGEEPDHYGAEFHRGREMCIRDRSGSGPIISLLSEEGNALETV